MTQESGDFREGARLLQEVPFADVLYVVKVPGALADPVADAVSKHAVGVGAAGGVVLQVAADLAGGGVGAAGAAVERGVQGLGFQDNPAGAVAVQADRAVINDFVGPVAVGFMLGAAVRRGVAQVFQERNNQQLDGVILAETAAGQQLIAVGPQGFPDRIVRAGGLAAHRITPCQELRDSISPAGG